MLFAGQPAFAAEGDPVWSTPDILSSASTSVELPESAISDDGNLIATVWYDDVDKKVRAARSTDAGASWSDPVVLGSGRSGSSPPAVATSSDGTKMMAAWPRESGGVNFATSVDGGETWSEPVVHPLDPLSPEPPMGTRCGTRARCGADRIAGRDRSCSRVAGRGDRHRRVGPLLRAERELRVERIEPLPACALRVDWEPRTRGARSPQSARDAGSRRG